MRVKKRICFLHHTGLKGGGTKSFLDVILMLKDDFELIACIPSHAIELEESLKSLGIRVERIKNPFPLLPSYSGGPGMFSRTFLLEILKWRKMRAFCSEIESLSPDFLFFNSIVTIVSAPFFSKKIGKVCFIRETLNKRFSLALFSGILKKYFSLSCFLAEAERDKFGLEVKKSLIIPDALPKTEITLIDKEEARKKEGIGKDEFCLLFMGGSAPLKGGRVLLQAMAKLTKKDNLLLCGSFKLEIFGLKSLFSPRQFLDSFLLSRAYKKALTTSKVTLIGFREDISTLMCATDVVVFPSMSAHQPRPCIEAGYYQKPVILTDFKETKEYFKDGFNALTFKRGSGEDLLSKILSLKNDEEKCLRLGMNNEKESFEKHDYERIQLRLKKALREELSREGVED